jgi:hypothetical protein
MTTKNINAKIFDQETNEFLSEIPIEVELVTSPDPNEKPYYVVKGKFNDMRVEFSDKNFILELSPSIRGIAFFTIESIMGCLTIYKIYLQDSCWLNLEWFEQL